MQLLRTRNAALLLATSLASGLLGVSPVRAQDAASINQIQRQIQDLQRQLRQLQQQSASRDAELKRARAEAAQARAEASRANVQATEAVRAQHEPQQPFAASTPGGAGGPSVAMPGAPKQAPSMAGTSPQVVTSTAERPSPSLMVGNVRVTLGGFIEAAGIYRSKNETADIASSWNGIPFRQSPNNHTGEFRETEHQSRLSLLVEAPITDRLNGLGYLEMDLNAAAPTANSTESNSYTPRVRQAFGQITDNDWGLTVLGGQAWSLTTQYASGLNARKENIPMTIDAQYLPGFTWLRVPQLRVTKQFGSSAWLAASFETPQTSYNFNNASGTALPGGIGGASGATVTYTNAGGSGFASTSNYSIDVAPDIVVKGAIEPGYGHYEAFGLARFFKARDSGPVPGNGSDKIAFAGGLGGSAVLPIVKGVLDVQGSVLAGYGIGRYGAGQLPDATIKSDGSPAPLPEIQALIGVVGHPVPELAIYGYGGLESIGRKSFTSGGKGYGYGSPLFVNSGCDLEISTATCAGNTRQLVQGTLGAWWTFLHSQKLGTFMAGAQYSYTRRQAFRGVGGAPSASENIAIVSLRYLPFQ